MYRYAFTAILAMAATVPLGAAPAETGQLDASPTLFTVMAALNATGFDADLASPNNHPLRNAVRAELAKRTIPSLPALQEFIAKHRRGSNTADLSQYISFALVAGGPPNFAIRMRDTDVPPDVSALNGFSPLLATFYKEAGIEDLWKRSQPAIDQYIARYHDGVLDAVFNSNVYLRQPTSGVSGRHFQIYIELLAPPNVVQTRSYGNEYTIVVTPTPEPRIFDIRHAYLHYVLDLLATRDREVLERKKALGDHALRATGLADMYKEDFLLLTTESLIKAVEAKLDRKPENIQKALLEGYVLTPYFAEQLPVYEKQEQAMQLYFHEMAQGINLVKEEARLSQVQFTAKTDPRVVKTPAAPEPALTGAAKTLDEAEQKYKADQFEEAKRLFLAVLQESDMKSMHAAGYYGLARIAVKQKDYETGERLLLKTLDSEPDPFVKGWTLVFLGRLSLAAREQDQAAKYFQSALQVQGASEEALKAAHQGVQQSSKQ